MDADRAGWEATLSAKGESFEATFRPADGEPEFHSGPDLFGALLFLKTRVMPEGG